MALDLPEVLRPTQPVDVPLPSGRTIALPHCRPLFPRWEGAKPAFGNKTPLNYNGEPVFAELFILRLLEKAGWKGRWVSSFGGKFLRDMPTSWKLENAVDIPERQSELLKSISVESKAPGGCFDVFAWRGDDVLFCESKRRDHDHLRDSQRRWMDAALACGVPEASLLVVEWDLTSRW
jgi:predicted dithiol-disulfide oxidoreductase (DUF899 family)